MRYVLRNYGNEIGAQMLIAAMLRHDLTAREVRPFKSITDKPTEKTRFNEERIEEARIRRERRAAKKEDSK